MGYKTLQDPQFAGLANYDPRALFAQLPTPAYVIDEERLRKNGEVLAALAERTGCRVLLAQKAFSNYDFYPLLSRYLAGTEASGLYAVSYTHLSGRRRSWPPTPSARPTPF